MKAPFSIQEDLRIYSEFRKGHFTDVFCTTTCPKNAKLALNLNYGSERAPRHYLSSKFLFLPNNV